MLDLSSISQYKIMPSLQANYVMLNALLNTKLTKSADNHLSIHGLSFTEFIIMHHLHHAPTKTMRRIELADAVGITASGVTRLLAPMEKVGIVQKDTNPRDARVSLVKLSNTGQTLYKEASQSLDYCAETLVSALTDRQLSTLTELSAKLI